MELEYGHVRRLKGVVAAFEDLKALQSFKTQAATPDEQEFPSIPDVPSSSRALVLASHVQPVENPPSQDEAVEYSQSTGNAIAPADDTKATKLEQPIAAPDNDAESLQDGNVKPGREDTPPLCTVDHDPAVVDAALVEPVQDPDAAPMFHADLTPDGLAPTTRTHLPPGTPSDLPPSLVDHYQDYQRTALREDLPSVLSFSAIVSDDGAPDTTSPAFPGGRYTMSKPQKNDLAEEGHLWASFMGTGQALDHDKLGERSRQLADSRENRLESYTRSQITPNWSTYGEVKTLLGAMGVPVVHAPAGIEAEAVGASLCLVGLAAAVGSEDTVRPSRQRSGR